MSQDFYKQFKNKTERLWALKKPNPVVYGFQIQQGTKWNIGLSDKEIQSYENDLGFIFPDEFKEMLGAMNGIDKPGLNLYGSSGKDFKEAVIFYSYPRNLNLIKERIEILQSEWNEIIEALKEDGGFPDLLEPISFIPLYSHRYLVGPPNRPVVCSIHGTDAILYADNLKDYLDEEFL